MQEIMDSNLRINRQNRFGGILEILQANAKITNAPAFEGHWIIAAPT